MTTFLCCQSGIPAPCRYIISVLHVTNVTDMHRLIASLFTSVYPSSAPTDYKSVGNSRKHLIFTWRICTCTEQSLLCWRSLNHFSMILDVSGLRTQWDLANTYSSAAPAISGRHVKTCRPAMCTLVETERATSSSATSNFKRGGKIEFAIIMLPL